MSATPIVTPAPTPRPDGRAIPRAGWMVIGAKEFGDHLLSARFFVLIVVLGIAAAVPLYFVSSALRDAASAVSGSAALFVALFYYSPPVGDVTLPSAVGFLAYVAPLLGLAFAFDAINGERADGTLPRLLSQPIHRDDVINGKFAAGLAVIGVVLVVVVGVISAFGLIRLGIVPAAPEILRIVLWVLLTFVYIGFWLAFGMLLSVAVRRAATSALIGFGSWLLLTVFGQLIVQIVAQTIAPIAGTIEEQERNFGLQSLLFRLLPDTLYREGSAALLNPFTSGESTSGATTIDAILQAQQRVPSLLSLDQSFILIWPQVVALVALTVACFALAYVLFMRQEVRA